MSLPATIAQLREQAESLQRSLGESRWRGSEFLREPLEQLAASVALLAKTLQEHASLAAHKVPQSPL